MACATTVTNRFVELGTIVDEMFVCDNRTWVCAGRQSRRVQVPYTLEYSLKRAAHDECSIALVDII